LIKNITYIYKFY